MSAVTKARTIELLDRQVDALGAMLAGLDAERDALVARRLDALNAAMDTKTECMARLEAIVGKLDGLPEFEDNDVIARRAQITVLSEQCRELNEANGMLIAGQQRFVTGALEALHFNDRTTATYGPDGENRQPSNLRKDLASA